jgi:hypothetical protein
MKVTMKEGEFCRKVKLTMFFFCMEFEVRHPPDQNDAYKLEV